MEAIESIWNEYHGKLYRFIQNRVSDTSIADDILQDVILKIHARIDTLKDRNKIQNWLYQITRNAIVDHYRAQKQTEELPETLTAVEMEPVDKAKEEISSCLQPMIQNLPDHYRQAIMEADIEGVKQKEFAQRHGLSLSAAKARVQRGRAMMKDMLLKCCHFEFDHQGRMIDYEAKDQRCDKC